LLRGGDAVFLFFLPLLDELLLVLGMKFEFFVSPWTIRHPSFTDDKMMVALC